MANEEHVALLKSSSFFEETPEWNVWRQQNPDIRPDLVEASLIEEDLARADLHQADMRGAVLKAARLSFADFTSADLRDASLGDANLGFATLVDADLSGADLTGADLFAANLRGARLRGASLGYANISHADFGGADLTEADLRIANTVETKFANAILTGCRVYGISAWGLKLDGPRSKNLVITPEGEPEIHRRQHRGGAVRIPPALQSENPRRDRRHHQRGGAHPWPLHTRAQSRHLDALRNECAQA